MEKVINLLKSFDAVSPTYGYIALALVKCSNEGGPGPRYNRKEDPGSSIFSMLVVYGYYLHLLPSSQNQVTGRTSGDPLPPSDQPGLSPPLPPGYLLHHLQRWRRGQPRRNHTSASDSRSEAADWARGGCGDHFGLFSAPVRGKGAELEASAGWPALFFIALLYIISGKPGRAGTTKTHPWRAGTGQESV